MYEPLVEVESSWQLFNNVFPGMNYKKSYEKMGRGVLLNYFYEVNIVVGEILLTPGIYSPV